MSQVLVLQGHIGGGEGGEGELVPLLLGEEDRVVAVGQSGVDPDCDELAHWHRVVLEHCHLELVAADAGGLGGHPVDAGPYFVLPDV